MKLTKAQIEEIKKHTRPALSFSELFTLQRAAEKIARRAGLLREARENGIC